MEKIKIRYQVKDPHQEGYQLLEEMIGHPFQIIYNNYGKPYIKESNLYFSISHSFHTVACVLSDHEIGIDIEKIRSYDSSLLSLLNINKKTNKNFFLYYTKKEAYLKKLGLPLKELLQLNDTTQVKSFIKHGYAISIAK